MDEEDQDELLAEIAAKHSILLDSRDPILMLRTINARILKDALEAQQVMLDQYKEELEGLALRWSTEATGKAEKVLTAALTASKEAMTRHLEDASAVLQTDINAAVERMVERLDQTRQVAMLNIVAAVIMCLAVAIFLWATIK